MSSQIYYLKNKDEIILEFELVKEKIIQGKEVGKKFKCQNIIYHKNLLPKAISIYGMNLDTWLESRKAPSGRENIEKILNSNNIDTEEFINISLCLSLNDTFWVCPKNEQLSWSDINLYSNSFNKNIALLAIGANAVLDDNAPSVSPEYTTNGMLRKCWHKDASGIIELFKGSSSKVQIETGYEVFNEYYLPQIADIFGFNCLKYDLKLFHNILVSSCKIFTDENIGFVPMRYCIHKDVNRATFTKNQIASISQTIMGEDSFADMMVFDGIIMNQDRHLFNFGMLVDNNTGEFLKPAPIFDNGFSIFNLIKKHAELEKTDEFKSINSLEALIESGKTKTSYFDITFDEQVLLFVKERHIEGLEKLKTFSFTKHSTFNLVDEELKLVELSINKRSEYLCGLLKDVLLDCETLQSNTQQQKFRINTRTGRREPVE